MSGRRMAPSGHQNSQTKVVSATHTVIRWQGGNLMERIRTVAQGKPTGALTILFSQGSIAALEWREKGTYRETFGETCEAFQEVRR